MCLVDQPIVHTKLAALQTKFLHYYPAFTASKKANGMLYRELLNQARLGAFFEIFTILALLMIIIIPIIFLLKNKQNKS